ncbi:MAG: hypothetical protein ABJD11_02290 [Gemmatimonadota bacterium]
MRLKNCAPFGALLIVVACGTGAGAGTRTPKSGDAIVLDHPEATLATTFPQVSNVIELRDGRVALADLKDRVFVFADFATGKVTTVGEHVDTIVPGDPAPGRHKFPGQVLRLPGDTVALVDFASERTSLWNEQGKFLSIIPLQPVAGGNQPLMYDSLGRAYKEDFRSVMGGLEPGAKIKMDSLPVLRFPRSASTADTIAELKLPSLGEGHFGEQTKMVATIFGARDAFGVLPDGWVWVARATDNRVDWRSPDGTWQVGTARPFEKIPVIQADKDRFMDIAHQNGLQRGVAVSFPFATIKPPFSSAVTRAPDQVWLLRSRQSGDSTPVYDVVSRDGANHPPVQLPKGGALAGFGKDGAVYVLQRGTDQRQSLGRYRIK